MSQRDSNHQHLTQEDIRCLTVKQFSETCGFSVMTAKRLIKAGRGPAIVQLSSKRIGITVRDAAEWLQARKR
jgi:predicted DNA-binding transcriptional regulator AlpA